MDPGHHWQSGEFGGGAPPPLIGVPDFNLPPLNFGPSIQLNPTGYGAPVAPPVAAPLTQDTLDVLSMSGTLALGRDIRVGPGGIRGYEPQSEYGAYAMQAEAGLGPPPGVQLTQRDLDFLTNRGTIILNDNVRVNSQGMRYQPAGTPQASPAANHQVAAAVPEVVNLKDLEVLQQLGAGASARVHLARHLATHKYYALKDMQVSLDKRALHELGTEIQISRTVESNHVVKCYNAFYEEGHMTLVLEYMDGGSVADVLLHVGRIAEFYLADIARQALRGFYDLHNHRPNPIIHRDIKPSNLLLNKAGELKISDFGVSRVLEDSNDVGKTFAGTYTYMSPERIVGNPYRTNSDIWAFGLSLLECAIGEYPYQPAMDYFTLLNAIKNRSAPRAPADEFCPEFCDFIDKCLQKEPEKRWSAEQLLAHPFCQKYESTQLVDLMNSV